MVGGGPVGDRRCRGCAAAETSIQVPDYVFALLGLDSEQDIGEWLSSALFAINGTIALLIARPPFFERNLRRYWIGLGIVLWILSLDEAVSLHERSALGIRLTGALKYAWVIPATVLVLLLGAWFGFGLIQRLPIRLRNAVFLAATVYVGGALGFEFIEGAISDGWLFGAVGDDSLPRKLAVSIQEALEMSGLVLLLNALLNYVAESKQPLVLEVR